MTMGKVLVDTSAWVDALRRDGDPRVRADVRAIVATGRAVLCDMVVVELWNGARGDAERRVLRDLEGELDKVETSPVVWKAAAELARTCRGAGVSAPAADLLIAACAEHHGLSLLHRDAHFDQIARVRQGER